MPSRSADAAASVLPPGVWPSPVTAADKVAYAGVAVRDGGDTVWWAQTTPGSTGRMSVFRHDRGGSVREVLPRRLDARTRVHEYGGQGWTVVGQTLVTSDFADQRLYRVDGGTALPLTPDTGLADRYAQPTELPGTGWVVCVAERHRATVRHALVAVALDGSGAVVDLWTGSDFVAAPAISPDGRSIAFLTWEHPLMPWDGTLLRTAALTFDQGRPAIHDVTVVLGGPEESVLAPSWMDDRTVCAATDRTGWWNLVAVPAAHPSADGEPAPMWPVAQECGVPLWQLGFRSHVPVSGGRTAVVSGGRLVVLDPDGTAAAFECPFTGWLPWLDAEGDVVAGVAAADDRAPAIVKVDTVTGAWTVLAEPPQPDPVWTPRPHRRTVPTPTGEVPVHFYPPTSPLYRLPEGAAPPAIMWAHGGPTASFPQHHQPEVAYFTSRGLAFVAVDYTGSSGRGRRHRTALRGQWGVADVTDCIAVARDLLERGRVSRIAIRGISAGGLTALLALARPGSPFAGGVSYAGVADLSHFARHTHEFESRYLDGLIGPLPEAQATYDDRSPLSHIDAVTRPVLLLHGERDPVVPLEQAQALAQALTAGQVPHALLVFADEGHVFGKSETIAAALEAELGFYGQLFGFDPPGVARLPLTGVAGDP
ncbi:prolyl oligopeptidase family serine peptidase [Dactylosporangium maewongense]|uniref:Prolyl oligopeptidase family serine peptidase n=1 Tax=Dactylosporangium maewongense TaxID=634393 RepID=A0ABN1ZN24_9ACTN